VNQILTSAARKAWAGFLLTALSPVAVLLTATDQPLTGRTLVAAVVSGVVGGLGVFYTRNSKATARRLRNTPRTTGRHEAKD
jgi:hypothetical protein